MLKRGLMVVCMATTLFAGGCATTSEFDMRRAALNQAIASEPPGNYFIGRRMFRRSYFFWGYIRKPRELWSTARLVMFNEQKLHAPDREAEAIGYDNNYEYRLEGYFSGEQVYEPASNRFYPEFVLTNYRLRSNSPPPIFRAANATDPNRITIDKPE